MNAAVNRVTSGPKGHLLIKVEAPLTNGPSEKLLVVRWDATYSRELPRRLEDLRFGDSRNHGTIARGVRKAEREGLEVRRATTIEDVRRWYPLYLEAMRAHAVPPRPLRFFEIAWEMLAEPGLMRLLLAEKTERRQRVPVAGSIFFTFGCTVFFAFNGRSESALPLRPNDAIHWQALADACRAGFRRFDFGEVSQSQHGLASYKKKWGAKPIPLHRYYYPKIGLGGRILRSESPAHKIAARVWQRLPLVVTESVGKALYR